MGQRLQFEHIWGGVVNYPAGTTFGPRVLGSYELVWIIQGQVVYFANGQSWDAPPGSIILARQGFHEAYQWDPLKQTRHAYFHLSGVDWPGEWGDESGWPVVRVMPDGDIVRPLFRYALGQIGSALGRQATPALVRTMETMLGAFIQGPLGQMDESGRQLPVTVMKGLDFIRAVVDEKPDAAVTLKEIAKAASVSSEHLCRLFRDHLDMGPMETLRAYRLDRAMGMIARSNLTIKEIAHRCGFASAYHFSRRFQQAYKRSPTAMRKRIEQGHHPPYHPLVGRMSTAAALKIPGQPS